MEETNALILTVDNFYDSLSLFQEEISKYPDLVNKNFFNQQYVICLQSGKNLFKAINVTSTECNKLDVEEVNGNVSMVCLAAFCNAVRQLYVNVSLEQNIGQSFTSYAPSFFVLCEFSGVALPRQWQNKNIACESPRIKQVCKNIFFPPKLNEEQQSKRIEWLRKFSHYTADESDCKQIEVALKAEVVGLFAKPM